MRIDKLYEALLAHVAAQSPNYGDDACSVLEMLYNAYNEYNGIDNHEIKQDFEDLYEAMNGKTLREKDRVIDAVCRLSRDHEKRGFADGLCLGIRLAQEAKLP